jgi:hypothetical protein
MRGDPITKTVRRVGTFVPLFLFAFISILAIVGCTSSDSDDSAPTVFVTPSGPPTLIPATATPASIAATPTEIPPTPIPTVAPAPTVGSGPVDQAAASFFLEFIEPSSLEIVVTEPDLIIGGRSLADALITVNDQIIVPDIDGLFGALVTLEPGPNLIEIVGSTFSGETGGLILTAVYLP